MTAARAPRDQRADWNDPRYVDRLVRWELLTSGATGSLLDALALEPGERVVDIGCGLGGATRHAAAAVSPHGHAVGVDISAALVASAARQAAGSPVEAAITFRVADAQRDDFDDGPFTAAMSQFGVMFFDDPAAGFGNIRRQLTPDGRLAFTCWQSPNHCPWSYATLIADLLPEPGPRADPAPGPFSLADPHWIRALLVRAGFERVEITSSVTHVAVPTDAILDDVELALMGVRQSALREARERVTAHLAPFRLPGGRLRLPLAFHLVHAAS